MKKRNMNKLKKGFVMIPNALFYDNRVSNDAKVLFCYIKSLSANYRNLRNSNLCLKLGISINTLQKAKKELTENGYLVVHRLSSANKYSLMLPRDYPKSTQSDYPKSTQPDYPKFGYHYKSNNNNSNNNNSKGFKKLKGFKDE
jgi:DNA-binding transcriptional MocR family regulator|tara:strand:- start:49 stop:477 length:429 start_codon:yes stop_codon:yes gene_type:complete